MPIKNGDDWNIAANSLAELNEEWEDYEDENYYFIDPDSSGNDRVIDDTDAGWKADLARKEIGNYFKTKKEAEKAVEKLKVWKRLKDKGFQPVSFITQNSDREVVVHYICEQHLDEKELTTVFGSE